METVTIRSTVDRRALNVADLAADYKARGMEHHRAWDQLIIDRGLVPGIDAKEFYKIFDSVTPHLYQSEALTVAFQPTHFDTLLDLRVAIRQDDRDIYHLLWESGARGTNPPILPPDPQRFVPIGDDHADN